MFNRADRFFSSINLFIRHMLFPNHGVGDFHARFCHHDYIDNGVDSNHLQFVIVKDNPRNRFIQLARQFYVIFPMVRKVVFDCRVER